MPPYAGYPGKSSEVPAGTPGAAGTPATTVAPAGRTAGIVLSLALLAVEIAWILRDIKSTSLHNMLGRWLDFDVTDPHSRPVFTTWVDGLVLVVLVGSVVAARRSSARGAFVTTGLLVAVVRLPGCWILTSDRGEEYLMHGRLAATSFFGALAGIALLAIGLLWREPAEEGEPGSGPRTAPVRPHPGWAVLTGVLLVLCCLETVGWQGYWIARGSQVVPVPHYYRATLFGARLLPIPPLAAPSGWLAWWTAVLAVVGAVAAFRRDALVRVLGLVVGARMLLGAWVLLDYWHEEHLLFTFGRLPDYVKVEQPFTVLEVVLGVLLLVVAGLRDTGQPNLPARPWGGSAGHPAPGPRQGWGPAAGYGPGVPPQPAQPPQPPRGAPPYPGTAYPPGPAVPPTVPPAPPQPPAEPPAAG
ncbi:hypothetical protein [Actinacidiphila yeochonensis]|uniref:hypothetical protein n=1 Tax=Actinacidiphila yeochonensis TaxID=89050 RepID=UPI000564C931|nr:hypothetical protein [Actinacidiphila yeochonensis]